MATQIPGGRPSPAQKKFLLDIVRDGGSSRQAMKNTGSFLPINLSKAKKWVTEEPYGDGTSRVGHRITTAGRAALHASDLDAYVAALPDAHARILLDVAAGMRTETRAAPWTYSAFLTAARRFEDALATQTPAVETAETRAAAGHVTDLEGPDSAGHWEFRCLKTGCDTEATGYEPHEVVAEAEKHAPLSASARRPVIEDDDDGDDEGHAGSPHESQDEAETRPDHPTDWTRHLLRNSVQVVLDEAPEVFAAGPEKPDEDTGEAHRTGEVIRLVTQIGAAEPPTTGNFSDLATVIWSAGAHADGVALGAAAEWLTRLLNRFPKGTENHGRVAWLLSVVDSEIEALPKPSAGWVAATVDESTKLIETPIEAAVIGQYVDGRPVTAGRRGGGKSNMMAHMLAELTAKREQDERNADVELVWVDSDDEIHTGNVYRLARHHSRAGFDDPLPVRVYVAHDGALVQAGDSVTYGPYDANFESQVVIKVTLPCGHHVTASWIFA